MALVDYLKEYLKQARSNRLTMLMALTTVILIRQGWWLILTRLHSSI